MKIYTKTGDQGTTSLFSGARVSKQDPFIEALGTVDEANSALGLALSFLPKEELFQTIKYQFELIQHTLFDLGAALATPRTSGMIKKLEKTHFNADSTFKLEQWIDAMEAKLPPLHFFILPGGHAAGSSLHVARSIVRRAERLVVPLYEQAEVMPEVLTYLNRLSDYLFVAARYVNHLLELPETRWEPHSS